MRSQGNHFGFRQSRCFTVGKLPTPFGELSLLELNDQETQQKVLFFDKRQLLEGLVAENHVDQILEKTVHDEERLVRLNVTSVLAGSSKFKKQYVLVLD